MQKVSTAMGGYLNMLNSGKPAVVSGVTQIANENYSREIMQLFTIGLNQLNQDGTAQLDGTGNMIPTYTQAQVQAFARAYTGWTYAGGPAGRFTGTASCRTSAAPFSPTPTPAPTTHGDRTTS